jgi:GNAT superfamily N-acetyltransferase
MYEIRRYTDTDEEPLFAMIEKEGDEWRDYWLGEGREKYCRAMGNSVGYLVFEGETLCGYLRCKDDDGFGVYVHDLLVDKDYRGKEYGRLLMERVCGDFPGSAVYVMGDIPGYYEGKLGYKVEGWIYVVEGAQT